MLGHFVIPALGYVSEVNDAGQLRRWQLENPDGRVKTSSVNRETRAIIYRLDSAAFSAANASAELDAVRAAFDQWQGVLGTRVKFEEGPALTGTVDVDSADHTNSVFWARSLTINGGRDSLRGILALTYVASFRDGNVIFDADTVFNGVEYGWFTDASQPTTPRAFVEAIALHEAGHALGLQHSPVGASTMFVAGELGLNAQVGLSWDEWTASRGLYPTSGTANQVGQVRGRVTLSGQPVFGAAVFAENAQGELLAGTVSLADGTYTLAGLPPGVQVVRAAPLDPLSAPNYLVRGMDISSAYTTATTTFAPSADRVVTVSAGGTSGNADLNVTVGSIPRIARILRPAANLASPSYTSYRVALSADGNPQYVGVLTTAAASADLRLEVTGKGFEAGPIVVRTNALPGMALVAMTLAVSPEAVPGLRSFRLRNATQSGWAHGFLEILPPFPDANGDGLDDTFQRRYWSRFTVPEAGPRADPDGDGFLNDWEHRTGSIPTNALSAHFEVESVRVTANGAVVRTQAAPGKRFQLLGRDTAEGTPWEAVGGPVTAASQTVEFIDPAATRTVRFYRVEMVP
jgi:hypothetical protein